MALRNGVHNVGAADDAHQPALANHRHALDLALGQQGRDFADGCVLADGNDLAAHDISDTQSLAVDLADNIRFRDHTDNSAATIKNGKTTNTLFGKELRGFLRAGFRTNGAYLAGHNVACNHW